MLSQVAAHGERIPAAAAVQMIRDSVNTPVYFELMDAIMRSGPPQSFDDIEVPVALVWGSKDRILPMRRYSQRLRDMLPDADWVELRGLGHLPMPDDPDLVARTISEFAQQAQNPAGSEPAHQSFTVA